MKIATWNVNSVKVRLPHLEKFLKDDAIDVLGIQELKTEEKSFPMDFFEALGYHCAVFGQKAYNGVALLSKWPIEEVKKDVLEEGIARTIEGRIGGLTILNVYFPHGGFKGDDKFFYKLEFYKKMKNYIEKNKLMDTEFILMGDFNVAHTELDVWDPVLLEGTIGFMKEEREALDDLMSIELIDAFRYFYPKDVAFTWWDYTGGSFRKNEGMRIDYMLVSNKLIPKLKNCYIERTFRSLEKPSDHVPVVLEISY